MSCGTIGTSAQRRCRPDGRFAYRFIQPLCEIRSVKTVSVLIRTLNRPAQLAEALASVAAQTYRPLEVVIVNDGGTPAEHIAERVLDDAEVSWRYHAHTQGLGRSHAANRALECATGELAMFLDDDDCILPTHIADLVRVLDNDATLIAAYSDTRCYRDGKPLETPFFARNFDAVELAVENYLPIHAVVFYRKVWGAGCRFSPALDMYEDWHFWLQVARLGGFQRWPEASACYRLDTSGVGGEKDRDYRPQYLAFLRAALPVLSDAQLIHLHYSSRALGNAHAELDNTHAKLDSSGAERDRICAELDSTRAELDSTRAELDSTCTELDSIRVERDIEVAASATLQRRVTTLESSRVYRLYPLERRLASAKKTLKQKSGTLKKLLGEGDWTGIAERLKRHLGRFGSRFDRQPQQCLEASQAGIDILCTRHTEFVARRISASLERLGIKPVRIISDGSGAASKRLCIVICPQMFTRMPASYIAFQMEQSVSSRWFNQLYINRLSDALAVMDYSITNLRYLQESGGLSHKYLYYVPISNLPPGTLDTTVPSAAPEYDVVFYGDANTPRRQQFLQAIEQRFSLLRVSEVFGDELYAQLRRARVVVNVHYYEGALLETTRLYECLSLGLPVVSESSVDIAEHDVMQPWVRFTPIDDVTAMVDAIDAELEQQRAGPPVAPEDDIADFHFYFTRMLVALGVAEAGQLDTLALPFEAPLLEQGVGLSLPETWQRRDAFMQDYPGYPVFPGLRHAKGWRGCALSYRYLACRALDAGLERLDIREDDALLDEAAQVRWEKASGLFDASNDYDILCGLMADLADTANVLDAFTRDGEDYVVIDCMTSMVCNRYGPHAMRLLAEWPFADESESNTIDRYLERQTIRVLVPLPFIATHRPDSCSTLWHFQNTTYDDMIAGCEATLQRLFYEALHKTLPTS